MVAALHSAFPLFYVAASWLVGLKFNPLLNYDDVIPARALKLDFVYKNSLRDDPQVLWRESEFSFV
jgi:hypothetical protein